MNFLKFRISCPFDTEEYCLKELKEKAQLLNIELLAIQLKDGEIRFESDLESVEKLQFYLKLPNRISLIVDQFKARDLPKLFQKVSKIPWRNYLINKEFQLKVISKKSRLNNEKKIISSFNEAIEKYYVAQNPKKYKQSYKHQIIVTVIEDQFEIAMDLSGDHLHKRSKRQQGLAPLRENYCALMYYFSVSHLKDEIQSIYDPMCGSGSILKESLEFYKAANREFAVQYLPDRIFAPRKKHPELEKSNLEKLFLSDVSEQAIENSKLNFKELESICEFQVASATKSSLFFETAELLLSNPPSDERMKFSKNELQSFLNNILNSKIKAACLMVPRQRRDFCLQILKGKSSKILNFKNSAIPVSLIFWTQGI